MSDTIYKGTNGQILVDNLTLTDKAGTGEATIKGAANAAWTAHGFKTEYQGLSISHLPSRRDSGKTFSNIDAAGAIQVTLPNPLGAGITFNFVRLIGQAFRIKPQDVDAIIYSGGQMEDGEYLELASNGARLSVVSDSNNNWVTTYESGTLTEQTP